MGSDIDLFQYLSLHIAFLKFFKLWFIPSSHKKSYKYIEFLINKLVIFSCFIVPTGSQLLYVIKIIIAGNADIQEVAGTLNLIASELLVFLRLVTLRIRRHSLADLIDQIVSEDFKNIANRHRIIFTRSITTSRRAYILVNVVAALDVVLHMIVVPGLQGYKTLPLKMDFIFFDNKLLSKEEYFGYVFAFQVLYKVVLLPTYLALQTFIWAFMLCAISHLDALTVNIKNMKEILAEAKMQGIRDQNEAFNYVIKGCITHHGVIIRFVNQMEKVFSEQAFFSLFVTSSVICTSAVQILCIESPMKNLTAVVWILAYISIVGTIFFFDCYFCNAITERGLNLSTIAFNECPWLNLSTSSKKYLVMFIARTQRPLTLRAGYIVPLSLETFKQVMNWTYKGFAVMNQMRK